MPLRCEWLEAFYSETIGLYTRTCQCQCQCQSNIYTAPIIEGRIWGAGNTDLYYNIYHDCHDELAASAEPFTLVTVIIPLGSESRWLGTRRQKAFLICELGRPMEVANLGLWGHVPPCPLPLYPPLHKQISLFSVWFTIFFTLFTDYSRQNLPLLFKKNFVSSFVVQK